MPVKICPICGAKSSEVEFKGSFCVNCYIEMEKKRIKTPSRITLYVCSSCGARKITRWKEDLEEQVSTLLKDKRLGRPHVRIDYERRRVYLDYDEGPHFEIPLKIKDSLCDECVLQRSGYYEGIIQVRGDFKERDLNRIIDALLQQTSISKIEESKHGVDIYVVRKKGIGPLLKGLGYSPLITHKLHTVKDGRRLYRTTFLIRL